MIPAGYKYRSDFAKKWIAVGVEQGLEQGIERGAISAKADALLVVLTARGLVVGEDAPIRIRACDDLATLDSWIARAAVVDRVDGIFAA